MGKLTLGVIVLAWASTGCAYMFKGSEQEVHVVANPAQSDIRQEGRYLGATPTTIEVDRNQAQNITVSKVGYKDQPIRFKKGIDTPWLVWDISTCAIPVLLCLPLLADALSGAWQSVDDRIQVKLEPLPAVAAPTPPADLPTTRAD